MTSDVRQQAGARSRSRVLDLIRSTGRISRVELARLSGLNDATVSHLVRRMIDDGLVVETGFSPSTGGKPRTLLDINSSARHAVGIALDSGRQTIVVTDLSGRLVGRLSVLGGDDDDPASSVLALAGAVTQTLADVQIPVNSVVGIGVASPGPVDVISGALRGLRPGTMWQHFPLADRLTAETGLRVIIDNDATCAALGEHWTARSGAPPSVTATVYMADGIGCGILIDGGIFHGISSNAGELGHLSLDLNGPLCRCGAHGCVELYAAPSAVAARALDDDAVSGAAGLVPVDGAGRENFARVARAAARGERACSALITDAATSLGSGVVALVNILDLDEVFLSGPGFADAGALFVRGVQAQLNRSAFTRTVHPVLVRLSHIGNDAAALGAAALVLQDELVPHTTQNSLRRRP